MAIEYDLVPGPVRKDKEGHETPSLVPKVVTSNTITTQQLAQDISHTCSFHEADVVGILEAFADTIAKYLNSSCHVELAGLGTLSLGIACDKDEEGHAPIITSPDEVKPHQLHVTKVLLSPKPAFMDRLEGPFVRSRQGFPSNLPREQLDAEARQSFLLAHLSTHPTITIGEYVKETGLNPKKASAELHRLADPANPDALLQITGTGTHIVFIKR